MVIMLILSRISSVRREQKSGTLTVPLSSAWTESVSASQEDLTPSGNQVLDVGFEKADPAPDLDARQSNSLSPSTLQEGLSGEAQALSYFIH